MRSYASLLRPHHYVKNLFVFAPVFFAVRIADAGLLLSSAAAFVLFSMTASSVYIFNDYVDIEADRKHPLKRFRPLASGLVKTGEAFALMGILLASGLTAAYLLSVSLFLILSCYVILNILYSFWLKHVSLVDVFIIAACFVLRIFAGAVVTHIELSVWIIVITFLLALFLALAKRRDDLLISEPAERERGSVDGYTHELINGSMIMLSSVIMVSYIMYTLSQETAAKFHTRHLFVTSIFVLFGILRYMQIAALGKSADPTEIFLSDRMLKLAVLGWLLSFLMLIY